MVGHSYKKQSRMDSPFKITKGWEKKNLTECFVQDSVHSAFLNIFDYLMEVEETSKNNQEHKEKFVKQQRD